MSRRRVIWVDIGEIDKDQVVGCVNYYLLLYNKLPQNSLLLYTVYYYNSLLLKTSHTVSLSQESGIGLAGTSGSKALKSSQVVDQGYSHLKA